MAQKGAYKIITHIFPELKMKTTFYSTKNLLSDQTFELNIGIIGSHNDEVGKVKFSFEKPKKRLFPLPRTIKKLACRVL